jgi:hypothetical protein
LPAIDAVQGFIRVLIKVSEGRDDEIMVIGIVRCQGRRESICKGTLASNYCGRA